MLSIISTTNNPYFNLATEEYLLKNMDEDVFYLYRNAPSIIVGTHQNTIAEINYDYVKEHDIPVVRRLSGGGAVFHDLGNLNFCFITNVEKNTAESFKEFTKPILEVLNQLGVEAIFSGRNDLTIDGKKFSGNAQHVSKNRILHHGTLLFSSNMADLSKALKVNPLKFKDKNVKSVKSRVTNISSHLPKPMSIEDFVDTIAKHITGSSHSSFYQLNKTENNTIQQLVNDKYNTWDWTYGKQATYEFTNAIRYSGGTIEYHFNVKNGILEDLRIYGDFFNKEDVHEIENTLVGTKHELDTIKNKLKDLNLEDYFIGIDADTFVKGLF